MVETNNAEERLARVEQMVEALQRENATLKDLTTKIINAVQVHLQPRQPQVPRTTRRNADGPSASSPVSPS